MALIKDEETASHDLISLLSSEDRDYLVNRNNDQVELSSLIGKTVGLYFSGSWCGPCLRFTPKLVQAYEQLAEKTDFEVVFISDDDDEESFNADFGKMPWLSLPFTDSEMRKKLKGLFNVRAIPHFRILDKNGHVLTRDGPEGTDAIYDFGAEGYPFTPERINQLREGRELAKREQSLRSLLVNSSRDFLISNGGNQVVVEELEGKTVGLYFPHISNSANFTKILVEIYNKLKERGENFEIVLVWSDDEEEDFNASFRTMPWLSLPFKDKSSDELVRYFQIRGYYPSLVIIGPDGKTLSRNLEEQIEEHGDKGYPFTPRKFFEISKAKHESQTLESILVHQDQDFVLAKDGLKVPVAELVGKTVLLYFSADCCPPCREFLPKFISVYEEIKAKDDAFEVSFVSSDRNRLSFDDYFYSMPWLALPFDDEYRKAILRRFFKIKGIQAIVAIGPDGKTQHTQVRQLIQAYGAEAFPFNFEHVKKLEKKVEEMAKKWPEKVKHELHHKHKLGLVRRSGYKCDGCREMVFGWSYVCSECNFDLRPKCALKKEEFEVVHSPSEDGFVCDGDVCHKA